MKELDAPNVLLALRDGAASDFDSLCREFDVVTTFATPEFDTVPRSYFRYELENVLVELQNAGLIVTEGPPNSFVGRIEVAPNWGRIQSALRLSLTEVGEKSPRSLTVSPYFWQTSRQRSTRYLCGDVV